MARSNKLAEGRKQGKATAERQQRQMAKDAGAGVVVGFAIHEKVPKFMGMEITYTTPAGFGAKLLNAFKVTKGKTMERVGNFGAGAGVGDILATSAPGKQLQRKLPWNRGTANLPAPQAPAGGFPGGNGGSRPAPPPPPPVDAGETQSPTRQGGDLDPSGPRGNFADTLRDFLNQAEQALGNL